MYMSAKSLAEKFEMSEITVRRRIEELRNEDLMYGKSAVIDDGCVRAYLPAFIHYISNRKLFQHRSMRKHVPEYQPEIIIKQLALNQWDIVPEVTDKEQIKELVRQVLREGLKQ